MPQKKSKSSSRISPPIIGIRELKDAEGKRIVVTIGVSRKAARDQWACPFLIAGLSPGKVRVALGIDALQATFHAFDAIHAILRRSNRRYTWLAGEAGDTGFRRLVPGFYGLAFADHVEKLIDLEIEQFARMAEATASKVSRFGKRSRNVDI
jgi:hypothetical protein